MSRRSAPARRAKRLATVGAVYTFPVLDGRFGACQVTKRSDVSGQVEVSALDYLASARPTVADVARLKVVRKSWGGWKGEASRCNVDERVPWWLELVAVVEPVESFSQPCLTFGGWAPFDVYHREQWESRGRGSWRNDTTLVAIDLGGGGVEVRRDASRLTLGEGGMFPLPASGPVRFEALDVLPFVDEITYTGSDPGFVEYISERKTRTVGWRDHGQEVVDLRASAVEVLNLAIGDKPVSLHAPSCLQHLVLTGHPDLLTVDGVRLPFPFALSMQGPRITAPPRGLEGVQCVTYNGLVGTDTAGLAGFSRLAELTLRGAPGRLSEASGLASLLDLREISIYEMYGLDAARWPTEWPRLDGVNIHGLSRADADVLKRAFAMVSDVRIRGARSEQWIAENQNNPFRSWYDDDPAFGRSACGAWRRAIAAARLGREASRADAERILKALVEALNGLGDAHDIDTIRREEAGDAFFALAQDLGVDEALASEWFDEWRDF